ncbi:hypothetical protein TCDM_01353 [Trypanosoma cruzi Dm28c]|uniref:Transmembrane protein n=2 Tax=Trypanosoma cruzi TaxID=5693 RepID=V5B9G1_TRYCR|nr:hypothetical protein TCDM_01353 [Trypanosoma cruzi Dm28c]PWU99701.1 hypothetical protein C4B63_8g525 [Trypanosoma cruzi]
MRRCALITVAVTSTSFNTASASAISQWGTRCVSYLHDQHDHCKSYRSATAFKLQPHEVNESNVPSAREVMAMIPSSKELQEQLPSAHELEAKYVRPAAVNAGPVRRQEEPPLWPNSDTVEEIMEEMRYGSVEEGDVVPSPSPEHILLAWRALIWGTLYAVIGVSFVVYVAMYACGMRGVGDVLGYTRGRAERERSRLAKDGEEVAYYVVDLTNPSTLVEQVREIWNALQEVAEDGDKDEHASSSREGGPRVS